MMDTLNMREALRDILNESRTVRQSMLALFVISWTLSGWHFPCPVHYNNWFVLSIKRDVCQGQCTESSDASIWGAKGL